MKEKNNINHLEEHQMSLYIDALKMDQLHKVPASILKHIDECDVCRTEAMDMYSMLGDQDYSKAGAHPTFDRQAKVLDGRRIFLRIAAAAAMIALAFFFYQRTSSGVPNEGEVVQEDPQEQVSPKEENPIAPPTIEETGTEGSKEVPAVENIVNQEPKAIIPKLTPAPKLLPSTQEDRKVFAANFTPSEHWESLVNENVRGDNFQAKSPAVHAVFKPGTSIPFQWAGGNSEKLQLILMNNKGKEVKTIALSGNEWSYKETLAPGRYYWKVENADDLLFVGCFEVAN